MIPVRGFEGRTVAVFGLARTGLAAARALIAGGALYQRKPSPEPISAPQNTAISPTPGTKWSCR